MPAAPAMNTAMVNTRIGRSRCPRHTLGTHCEPDASRRERDGKLDPDYPVDVMSPGLIADSANSWERECLPAAGAPLGNVRALHTDCGVLAVAGIHPGAIRQFGEDPLLEVGDQAAEPLGVTVRVARTAGEQRITGEQVRLVGELAVAVIAEGDASRRVPAQVNHREPGVADSNRVT